MTDNEIINGLKCIGNEKDVLCKGCAYKPYDGLACHRIAARNALNLINRQEAEIERLTERNFDLSEKGEKVCIAYKELAKKYELAVAEREANVKGFTEALEKQKAEIERLNGEIALNRQWLETTPYTMEQIAEVAKAEAVKEFAKKLLCNAVQLDPGDADELLLMRRETFDRILKEKTGAE